MKLADVLQAAFLETVNGDRVAGPFWDAVAQKITARWPDDGPCSAVNPHEHLCAEARRLRLATGLSLQGAADRIGCTKAHLWEIERGTSANPSLNILLGMARAYGVTVGQLIGEGPPR